MASVGRLAGAILAETEGKFFLVGNTKEPCDFVAAGFEPPGEIDVLKHPYARLLPLKKTLVAPPCLTLGLEGEALPQMLAERFLIQRNGSVSERLWSLVTTAAEGGRCDWLAQMPSAVWQIIRDTVLKCI